MNKELQKIHAERERLIERRRHVQEKQKNQENDFKKIEEKRDEIQFRAQQLL